MKLWWDVLQIDKIKRVICCFMLCYDAVLFLTCFALLHCVVLLRSAVIMLYISFREKCSAVMKLWRDVLEIYSSLREQFVVSYCVVLKCIKLH